ncbi:MAG: nucleotidyltransferase domain-containing protein [Treponema sp.]|nr:nucleotidyltransferase domain-containing protein [Treponema sp.]
MRDIKEKLNVIKEVILKSVQAKQIYLFGSYAYGTPTENSDIDIYAVIPDNFNKGIIDTMGEVINQLYNNNILNVDLFLIKESKFLFYKKNSSFEETICNKGMLLYETV